MTPAPPAPDPAPTASVGRYLLVLFVTCFGLLGLAWAYVAAAPVAFMESGWASWTAKATMLDQCRLGEIAFFGDSRLEAGIVPADFPVPVSNFGFAGGSAVEVRVAVDRALACADLPRQAVITLVPEHFGPLSEFYWLLSLRYGFLSLSDALATRNLAAQLGDRTVLGAPTPDGMRGWVRDVLYAVHFPSLSFSSLVSGRVAGRLGTNRTRLGEMLRDRGWAAYERKGEVVPADHPDRFVVSPVQQAELDSAISSLRRRGVAVALLIMPFAPDHPEADGVLDAYRDQLAETARRTGATLLDPVVPIWPDRFFADRAHLVPTGARAFTGRLAECLVDGTLRPPCALPPPGEQARRD